MFGVTFGKTPEKERMPWAETMYLSPKLLKSLPTVSSDHVIKTVEKMLDHLENVAVDAWPDDEVRNRVSALIREVKNAHLHALDAARRFVVLVHGKLYPDFKGSSKLAMERAFASLTGYSAIENAARKFTSVLGDLRQMVPLAEQSEQEQLRSYLSDLETWHRVAVGRYISESFERFPEIEPPHQGYTLDR